MIHLTHLIRFFLKKVDAVFQNKLIISYENLLIIPVRLYITNYLLSVVVFGHTVVI
jgi:hypothetical protein